MKTKILIATVVMIVGFSIPALAQSDDDTGHEAHVSLHTHGAEGSYHMFLPEGLQWSARVNAINIDSLTSAASAFEEIESSDDWTGSFSLGYFKDFGEAKLSLSGMMTYGEESGQWIPGFEARVQRDRWIGYAAWHHEDDDIVSIASRNWRGVRVGVGISF